MKVKVGDRVSTEFGDGPIVAMSREWCIVECGTTSGTTKTPNEVAVPWDEVSLPAEADGAVSSINEKELS
jgi:hypothetical protein